MKRLSYISNFAYPLSAEEIKSISEKSIENNKQDGLTGVLFCFKNFFYQILEGDENKLSECYARILKDPRHKDIFCLQIEDNIEDRKYEGWHMKTVRLEDSKESILVPVRAMLNALAVTHRILEKYAPLEVIYGIQKGENPLEWKPLDRKRVILFSDIVSSTTLTENFTALQMEEILNKYYGISIKNILDNGGQVSKLMGDGIMCYFSMDNLENAVRASMKIQQEFDEIRKQNKSSYLSFLFSGIGISFGTVREGNIGSDDKKDYTIIGDPVNRAARLESVTRKSGYNIILLTLKK